LQGKAQFLQGAAISSSRFLVLSSWFSVPGSQFSVLGSWFLVLSSQFSVLGSRFLVLSSRFLVPGSQFSVPGSQFSVPGSRFSVPGSQFSVLGSQFSVLKTEERAVAFHEQSHPSPVVARRTVLLVVGDALALLIFAALGRASHGEDAGLTALAQVAETAAPFIVGWFAVAPLFGTYRTQVTGALQPMLARTALTWLIAWPIGLGLRALIRQTTIPVSFALVTFVTVLAIMSLWRGAFALIAARR
jgi:hypothetical protein